MQGVIPVKPVPQSNPPPPLGFHATHFIWFRVSVANGDYTIVVWWCPHQSPNRRTRVGYRRGKGTTSDVRESATPRSSSPFSPSICMAAGWPVGGENSYRMQ